MSGGESLYRAIPGAPDPAKDPLAAAVDRAWHSLAQGRYVRCIDCLHDMQSSVDVAMRVCPMWGKNRTDACLQCEVFTPREER